MGFLDKSKLFLTESMSFILKLISIAIPIVFIYFFIGAPFWGKSELDEMEDEWAERKKKAILAEQVVAGEIIDYFTETNINLEGYRSEIIYKCHPRNNFKYLCNDCYIDEEGVIEIDDYGNSISVLLPLPENLILDSHSSFMVEIFDVIISQKNVEIDLGDGVSTIEVELPIISCSAKLIDALPTYYDFVRTYESKIQDSYLPISKVNVVENVLIELGEDYSVYFN